MVESNDEIRLLQEAVLKSVLLGVPLPGSSDPLSFPDIGFLRQKDLIYVMNENLYGPISLVADGKTLVTVDRHSLESLDDRDRPAAYLRCSQIRRRVLMITEVASAGTEVRRLRNPTCAGLAKRDVN